MANVQQYIPDQSGTIYVKGHEKEIAEFTRKKTFLDMLEGEVKQGKEQVRNLATQALAMAAEGAMRVCILGGVGAAVSTTVPDYAKDGNRLTINDATFKKLMKLGGPEALEMAEGELFDTQSTVGSKSLVLTGKWLTWFEDMYIKNGQIDLEKEEDIKLSVVEPSTSRRLSFAALAKLKAISITGSEKAKKAATLLLDAGLKAMTVRVDEGD